MSMAAMLGGLAYGTDSAGAAHAMSQSAGGVIDAPHGALDRSLAGTCDGVQLHGRAAEICPYRPGFGRGYSRLSIWQAAEKAVEAVYRLTEDVEIATMQELGFNEEQIPMLAELAVNDPQTIGNPRDISEPGYVKVYQRAFDVGKGENRCFDKAFPVLYIMFKPREILGDLPKIYSTKPWWCSQHRPSEND